MGHIRIAGGPRRHARSGSLPGLPLAFVSERVERGRDHQGGRQAREVIGEQGRGIRMPAGGRIPSATGLLCGPRGCGRGSRVPRPAPGSGGWGVNGVASVLTQPRLERGKKGSGGGRNTERAAEGNAEALKFLWRIFLPPVHLSARSLSRFILHAILHT